MIDTQRALNIGGGVTTQIQLWLDSSASWVDQAEKPIIDPFFGCSVRLPRLMVGSRPSTRALRINMLLGINGHAV